jgi:hypothetical protein
MGSGCGRTTAAWCKGHAPVRHLRGCDTQRLANVIVDPSQRVGAERPQQQPRPHQVEKQSAKLRHSTVDQLRGANSVLLVCY